MKRSVWTRNLLDTPFGRFLFGFIIPALSLSQGLKEIITGEATFKRVNYTGFDAVCIGNRCHLPWAEFGDRLQSVVREGARSSEKSSVHVLWCALHPFIWHGALPQRLKSRSCCPSQRRLARSQPIIQAFLDLHFDAVSGGLVVDLSLGQIGLRDGFFACWQARLMANSAA